MTENFYQKHVFFCLNQKPDGKKCCVQGDAEAMAIHMADRLKEMDQFGPGKIRVSKAGCLGRCGCGPNIVIYPESVWYRYNEQADIDRIIEQHLIGGQLVEDLLTQVSAPQKD